MELSTLISVSVAANSIVAVVITVIIILDDRDSPASLAWILALYLLPFAGIFFFALTGINWRKRKRLKLKPEELFESYYTGSHEAQLADPGLRKFVSLLHSENHSRLTFNNRCRLFHKGGDFFDDLLRELAKAQSTIHMDFFIWRSDALGQKIKRVLVKKAAEGVKIKLIFDGLGSFLSISRSYYSELKKAGIDFCHFHDKRGLLAHILKNYNNHKKIIIIDGKIAYTGGMNIGEEYINGGKRFASWRDTQVRVEGEEVSQLQAVFLTDWFNCGNQAEITAEMFPGIDNNSGATPMQTAVSGPDSTWNNIASLYFCMITRAAKTVHIQSPYFIPDQATMKALETAALSGTQVNLMITGHPDKKAAWWCAHTYFKPLLTAGARIFLYKGGFLHQKLVVIDGQAASIGSCNLDIRSFNLHYELNVMIYDSKICGELIDHFNRDTAESTEITLEEIASWSLPIRLRNSLMRVFSPLM